LRASQRPLSLYSNDVSAYSCFLGWALVGKDVPLAVKHPIVAEMHPKSPAEKWAAVCLAMHLLEWEGRDSAYHQMGLKRVVAHRREIYTHYKKEAKILAGRLQISGFTAEDALDVAGRLGPDDLVITAPPTYVGGYERLYKKLESAIDYPRPEYEVVDDEWLGKLLARLNRAIVIRDRPVEGLRLVGKDARGGGRPTYCMVKGTGDDNAGKTYCISRSPTKREALPHWGGRKLNLEDVRRDEVALMPLGDAAAERLRWIWGHKAVFGASPRGGGGIALVIRGRVAAFAVFAAVMPCKSGAADGARIFMIVDMTAPGIFEKASRFWLEVLCTKEARQMLEETHMRTVGGIQTTVYTDKPVSMKYRGLFRKIEQKKGRLSYAYDYEAPRRLKSVLKKWKRQKSRQLLSA